MNDLISRKALIAEYDRVHIGEPGGARKLMEYAPAVCEWIPVSERLPEENTLCLYFTPYDGDREWDMGVVCFRNKFIFVSHTGGATHWMPLPEPPKGE